MESTEERKCHVDLVRAHLVDAFAEEDDPGGAVERCGEKIAKYLNAGSLMLVDVVDVFGDKLTSQDVEDRAKAVDVLHYTFAALQPSTLSANDLTYLVEFLVDRLRDQHLVIPKVILCLQPIVLRFENLPPDSCSKILNRVFMEVNMQTNVHRIRRSFFSTVRHMLRTKAYLQDLQDNTPNFVEHFIDAFAGEKDPRNLVILFNIVPTVLQNFPIQPLEEELFEALACYFPIDFNPVIRPNSTDTITREDLASGLHFCLSRTNLFSKFLIPLALEKLASDLLNAKLDSLRLLAACCEECYGPDDLRPFLSQIWHQLRREIFLEPNEIVEATCVDFIRAAFNALSKDVGILKESVATFFSECKHHLSEPALRLSQPASKVLLAIAEANATACAEVFALVVPLLHQQFLENGLSSNRKAMLGIMTRFIAVLSAFPSLSIQNLLPNASTWDEIVGSWFTLLTHSDSEYVSLALGLFQQIFENELAHFRARASTGMGQHETGFGLDVSYRNTLQEHLSTLIFKETGTYVVAVAAVRLMERFASTFPAEFICLLVPKLLLALDKKSEPSSGKSDLNPLILKAVSECASVPAIAVGRVILPKLIHLSTAAESESESGQGGTCLRLQIAKCLNDAVDKICMRARALEQESTAVKEFIDFICGDMEKFVNAGTRAYQCGDRELCEVLAEIVTKVLRTVDAPAQQMIVDKIWNGRLRLVDSGSNSAKLLQLIPIPLLEALLAPLHPCVIIERKTELMDELLDKITSPESESQSDSEDSEAHAHVFAVLHNKLDDSEFENLLSRVETHLQTSLFDHRVSWTGVDGSPVPGRHEEEKTETEPARAPTPILSLLIWTTKSLAMKGSPQLLTWIDKLISLLGGGAGGGVGAAAAEGFAKILSDGSSSSLVPENNCAFKFLYKQRFFLLSVPKLITAYRQCAAGAGSDRSVASAKMNYIKALSCQLKYVPKSVLHAQLENVIPLLIAGLSVGITDENHVEEGSTAPAPEKDPQVVLTSLTAIFELFTIGDQANSASGEESTTNSVNSASLVQYFCDLAPRLLELASFKANMEIRIFALKCLQRASKFPAHVILPLKGKIVAELAKSLDDPKRLVRSEAVLTRNVWILSGAPGGL